MKNSSQKIQTQADKKSQRHISPQRYTQTKPGTGRQTDIKTIEANENTKRK